MKIKVKVHANPSREKISRLGDKQYEVWTKKKPIEGKANAHLTKMLKKYFNKEVGIVSGFGSKNKIVELK